jgi:transglutaminase-like putative cysteine protease
MASLGQVALGLASIIYGAHHLRRGVRQLRGEPGKGLSLAPSAPQRGRPFHDSGQVRTKNGLMRMRSYHIRDLDDRIKYLRECVDAGKRDPRIYAFAREATSRRCGDTWCVPEKDNVGEAKAIFDAIRRRVRYTSDIYGVDTYQKPHNTLRLSGGDCDDLSVLSCSALLSVGIPCRFKVIRTRGAGDWNHIYAQAGFPRANPTRWISLDASVPVKFGWEAPPRMVEAFRVFPVR